MIDFRHQQISILATILKIGILIATIQFQYFPECIVLTFTRQLQSRQQEFQMRSGSASSAQLTALVQRQEKCHVIPAHCSCSTGKDRMLAGSEIIRWSNEGEPYHHARLCKGEGYPASLTGVLEITGKERYE